MKKIIFATTVAGLLVGTNAFAQGDNLSMVVGAQGQQIKDLKSQMGTLQGDVADMKSTVATTADGVEYIKIMLANSSSSKPAADSSSGSASTPKGGNYYLSNDVATSKADTYGEEQNRVNRENLRNEFVLTDFIFAKPNEILMGQISENLATSGCTEAAVGNFDVDANCTSSMLVNFDMFDAKDYINTFLHLQNMQYTLTRSAEKNGVFDSGVFGYYKGSVMHDKIGNAWYGSEASAHASVKDSEQDAALAAAVKEVYAAIKAGDTALAGEMKELAKKVFTAIAANATNIADIYDKLEALGFRVDALQNVVSNDLAGHPANNSMELFTAPTSTSHQKNGLFADGNYAAALYDEEAGAFFVPQSFTVGKTGTLTYVLFESSDGKINLQGANNKAYHYDFSQFDDANSAVKAGSKVWDLHSVCFGVLANTPQAFLSDMKKSGCYNSAKVATQLLKVMSDTRAEKGRVYDYSKLVTQ